MIIKQTCDDERSCEQFTGPYRNRQLDTDFRHEFQDEYDCDCGGGLHGGFHDSFGLLDDDNFKDGHMDMNFKGCCCECGCSDTSHDEICCCKVGPRGPQGPIGP